MADRRSESVLRDWWTLDFCRGESEEEEEEQLQEEERLRLNWFADVLVAVEARIELEINETIFCGRKGL